MTTHVDGDDYTWQAGPVQAGPVFIPDAQPGTAEAWAERWQRQAVRAGMQPDLRTLAEREHDDVDQLALRCDNLVDVVAALHRRMAALEAIVRAKVQVGQIDAERLDALERELNLLIQRVDKSTRLAQLERTVAALVRVLEIRL